MKACYPGSFDPITNGHIDIIVRAAKMFDEVIVLIMQNPRKKTTFSLEERIAMIQESIEAEYLTNVRVEAGDGLTVDVARSLGAKAIIRGIRAVSDYEYELQQATANMLLAPDIETVLLIAAPVYSFLSSSVVKEIGMNNGDITGLLPEGIKARVADRLKDETSL